MSAVENDAPESLASQYSDWMSQLPSELHDVPLNQLAIPGSHNSFTANLTENQLGPDTSPQVSTVVKLLKKENIVYQWSKTQTLSISHQLNLGIRYLDLRVCKIESSYRFTHGLLSGNIADFIVEVREFLEEHPKEIIFLDFNHFYNMESEEDHKNLIKCLKGGLGRERLCLYVGVDQVKLSDLWASNQQVLIFYHHSIAEDHPELWPGDVIAAPWANTDNSKEVYEFNKEALSKERPTNKFFVSQGVLTPKIENIVKAFFNNKNLEVISDEFASTFVNWLSEQIIGPKGINIVSMDFCEKHNYVSTVIGLNSPASLVAGQNAASEENNIKTKKVNGNSQGDENKEQYSNEA